MSVDIYRTSLLPQWWSLPKYIWRPITKRMQREKLLGIIKWYIPKYISIDTIIKKIPKVGGIISAFIPVPCWNYLDKPASMRMVKEWLEEYSFASSEIFYGSNGIVINLLI